MKQRVLLTAYWVAAAAVAVLTACGRFAGSIVPDSAGPNRGQLEEVLETYGNSSEPLKYEAAEFLIKHMGWHVSAEADGVYADAAILSADFLREHIDHAYGQWKSSAYAKELSFEEFCEYLLPYRAALGYGGNQTARERYEWVMENVGIPDSIRGLKELIWHYNNAILPIRERQGRLDADCRDKAVQTCLNLRAIGVPCVVQHTIGYRTLRAHHYYCAAFDTQTRQWVRFHGESIKYYPGDDDWTSPEMMNVYRETYAPQPDPLFRADDFRPYRFESPCQLDVTEGAVGIEVPVDGDLEGCVPYLATFHRARTGLQPFTSGRPSGRGKVAFDRAVPTVWYVVTIYPQGRQQIVSRPFWVEKTADGSGRVRYAEFEPEAGGEVERIVLRRKYPVKDFLVRRIETLIGATIEGANRPDFSDARTLWRLDSMPQLKVVNYPFDASGNYRYYRLQTPGACEVSVLEWLKEGGEAIAPPDAKNKAYDGDMTTGPTDTTAIVLALEQPQRIVAVNMAPVNADNAVKPGHVYQLHTWSNRNGWTLHATRRAEADSIIFERVPKHTLLWLKNITTGQEEMPMFYDNGQQRFLYRPYDNHPAQARVTQPQ
ncbi:MAG: hypothetical protein HDS04_01105 [Bacteroides sp.]|nr:hypothetical protein [Bacteroides sp.]